VSTLQVPIIRSDGRAELNAQLTDIGRVSPRPWFNVTLDFAGISADAAVLEIGVLFDGLLIESGDYCWMFQGRIAADSLANKPFFHGRFGRLLQCNGHIDVKNRRGFLQPGSWFNRR
jgi:hypothetical protein